MCPAKKELVMQDQLNIAIEIAESEEEARLNAMIAAFEAQQEAEMSAEYPLWMYGL